MREDLILTEEESGAVEFLKGLDPVVRAMILLHSANYIASGRGSGDKGLFITTGNAVNGAIALTESEQAWRTWLKEVEFREGSALPVTQTKKALQKVVKIKRWVEENLRG